MVYMGSEGVQFIEGQMLGRVFLDLGVRGGRIQKWSYEVAVNRDGG